MNNSNRFHGRDSLLGGKEDLYTTETFGKESPLGIALKIALGGALIGYFIAKRRYAKKKLAKTPYKQERFNFQTTDTKQNGLGRLWAQLAPVAVPMLIDAWKKHQATHQNRSH